MNHQNKPEEEVARDIFPYLQLLKDGTIKRLAGTEVAAPGFDPETGVLSKDVVLSHKTGVRARLYRPAVSSAAKLPLVVYFHGGAFFISSIADPKYHQSLNKVVAQANVVLVTVDYRLAPEHPLPAAYDDSWAALQWIASHNNDDWIVDYADFDRFYLAGDSAGANIAHHLGLKLKDYNKEVNLKVQGIVMIHPYFWGKDPIGREASDDFRRSMVDNWWSLVCPSEKGNDDPLINPFSEGSPAALEGLASRRLLVVVAENDILRDRGWLYYDKLKKSGWKGKAEIVETEGVDHVFHILDPSCDKARKLFKRLSSFINQDKT